MALCENCGTEFATPTSNPRRRSCSRSCAVALSWKNSDTAARRQASIKAQKNTPEGRAQSTESNNKRWSIPGQRERLSDWNRERWADPKTREELSAAIKATHSTPEMRAFYSQLRTADWARPSYREKMIAAVRAHHGTPEARAKFSVLLRGRWQDPILRPKYLAGVRANAAKMKGVPRGLRKRLVVHVPIPEMKVHRTRAEIMAERRVQALAMKVRRARFKSAPKSTSKELVEIAARSRVTIKRYPMGAALGWKPSWMT